jgi:hypothetical protein
MPAWQVMRRMRISNHDLDAVRDSLVGQRLVEFGEERTGGTPKRLYRLAVNTPHPSIGAAIGASHPGNRLVGGVVAAGAEHLLSCNRSPIDDQESQGRGGVNVYE